MKTAKVTRILHSQGLHKAKFERLTRIAARCGRVRADAWQRCSGLTAASRSAYEIRNAWMTEGYDWHGLPARLGKATLLDALDDIHAARNILQRLYDDGITLYMPYREVKRLLLDRSGTTDGTAHPGLEPARQLTLS